tara:strand:+ start:226 stop:555 length:330 start_codon:yes stop_codon:yes gene_type:complete
MTNQIFKKNVPNELLFTLLDKICFKTDEYYLIDNNAYRKLLFYNLDKEFVDDTLNYYHLSKQFYILRKMTYKSFTNIIRQICKQNLIQYTTEMKYNESKYNIVFKIYNN